MKNTILLLIVPMILALAEAASAQTAGSASGALSLVNVGIYPQPVYSGSNATITFQLYNSYSQNLNNVNLQLVSQSPLINVSPTYTFLINAIGTGLYGGIGYNSFHYTFHIPSATPSGVYTIDVVASYETSQTQGMTSINVPAQSVMPITFYVYGRPHISLTATPASIMPGQEFNIQISAVNGGSGGVENANVTLSNTSAFKVVGPSIFNLGNIPAGGMSGFSAMLYPEQNIKNGTYAISATVSYTDQFGKISKINQTLYLNVLVQKPDITVSMVNAMPQALYPGSNQTLQISIQNTGNGLAKNVSINFYNTSALNIGSVSSFYIGQLPPGASQIAQLYISANRNLNKTLSYLPGSVSYEDANYENRTIKLISLPISLEGIASFNVTSVNGTLMPGATYVPVTFHLVNIGNENAQQVSFSLQAVYPITPVTPNAYVASIAPGQGANVTFYVDIDTQASSGEYPVTIYETWRQPNGGLNQQFSASENFFAVVGSTKANYSAEAWGSAAVIAIIIIVALAAKGRNRKKRKGGEKA